MVTTTLPEPGRMPAAPQLRLQHQVILALDLGQTTGWAVRAREGVITHGTVQFRPGRHEGGGMPFLRFRAWLQELDETVDGIDCVFFEEVRGHRGTTAAQIYGGFLVHRRIRLIHPIATVPRRQPSSVGAAASVPGHQAESFERACALAHLTAWAELNKTPYEGVPVGTIKRHVTGRGNASKEEVIAAVQRLGFDPADDNEADTLALLDWVLKTGGRR